VSFTRGQGFRGVEEPLEQIHPDEKERREDSDGVSSVIQKKILIRLNALKILACFSEKGETCLTKKLLIGAPWLFGHNIWCLPEPARFFAEFIQFLLTRTLVLEIVVLH